MYCLESEEDSADAEDLQDLQDIPANSDSTMPLGVETDRRMITKYHRNAGHGLAR